MGNSKWARYKKDLWNKEKDAPILYMPLEIPEFDDWEVMQPCVERMKMIRTVLWGRSGSMVDLGCHTGWFCREFWRDGWIATGIDRSLLWTEVAREMNDILGIDVPAYVHGNLDEIDVPAYVHGNLDEIELPRADVVLCLSTAMYLFDKPGDPRGWERLNRFSLLAPMMFLDFGGQYAKRLPFDRDTAIDEIVEHTAYGRGELLGNTGFEERPFYVFRR